MNNFDDFDTQIQIEEVQTETEPDKVRLSLFSVHHRPHHLVVPIEDLDNEIGMAKDQQYGIVVTNVEDDKPQQWDGPGIQDLR